MGDWDGAASDVAEVDERASPPDVAGWVTMIRGLLAAVGGDSDAFQAAADESARVLADEDMLGPQLGGIRVVEAQALLALGDPRAAFETLAGLAGGGNDVYLAMTRSVATALLGDARAHAAIPVAFGFPEQATWTRGLRKKMAASEAALAGRWEEARMAYADAVATYRGLETNLWASWIGLEFDAFLGAASDEARRAGEEAAEFFTSRGAGGVVDRYKQAFQATPAPAATDGHHSTAVPARESVGEVEAR
jgi:hypothetical protein